jgi:hypothetical protein
MFLIEFNRESMVNGISIMKNIFFVKHIHTLLDIQVFESGPHVNEEFRILLQCYSIKQKQIPNKTDFS